MSSEKQSDSSQDGGGGSSSWSRVLFTCTALLGLVVAVTAIARYVPITRHFLTDAETIRVRAADVTTRDILWQPARALSELVNTTADDYEPRLSADGLTLYFVRGKAGENADIFVSIKSPDGWSEPTALEGVNSEHDELGPELSADGKAIYFYSDRPKGFGGYDLWVARRGIDGWQSPINLGPSVNSEFNDYGPALTPSGEVLYFASNRPAPQDAFQPDPDAWRATLREDLFQRTYDLYEAAVTDGGFGTAQPLSKLNTRYNDGAPAVSSFGDFVYFTSDRPGGEGGFDLYRSRRLHGDYKPAKNLGSAVNTVANELDPGLSLGGYALYFSSDRVVAGDVVDAEPKREYNLYYTNSREVFTEIDRLERPPINWAALWVRMGPNFLWALLALLLLLLLLALLRDMQKRQMGLLAKCLLTSVMAHLLLMLLLNTWEVTSALAKEFRRRGPIQVAMASNEVGNELASQIRGQLTSITPPEAPTIELERQSVPPESVQVAAMASLNVQDTPRETLDQSTFEETPSDASIDPPLETALLTRTNVEPTPPTPLETTIPSDSAPSDAQEPDSATLSDRLASAERLEVRRADNRPTETLTEAATAQLIPKRSADRLQKQSANQTSLAPIPEARDAATESTTTALDSGRMVAAFNIPVPDISLPTAKVERLPEIVESEPSIRVPASVVPRRKLADASAESVTVADIRRIQPGNVSRRDFDATLVEEGEAVPSDSSPAEQSARVTTSISAEASLPSFSQIELMLPEATVATKAVERSFAPEPSFESRERAATSTESSSMPSSTDVDDFQPVATGAVSPDQSLAESLTSANDDASSDSTLDNAASSTAVAMLPAMAHLALPSLEQTTHRKQSESEVRVAEIQSDIPRAALRLSDVAQDSLAQVDLFGPVSLGASDRDEAPQSLAALRMPVESSEPTDAALALNISRNSDYAPADPFGFELSIPTETRPPENPYLQREAGNRESIVDRMGGSDETERAVADALRWLAEHQSSDGHWDGSDFDDECGDCGGETHIAADNALTGLALMAFLGSGHTHVTDGPYRSNIRRAMRWLVARQKSDGDLRGAETMYSHGIASIALSEAYGMSHDAKLAEPVRKAVWFIETARNTDEGGWRYDPGQAGDTSVLGWQVMALKSATLNGISVPAEAFGAARDWMDKVDRGSRPGLIRYRPEDEVSPSMTAEGMFIRQLLGMQKSDPRMDNAAAYIVRHLPDWDEANTYFWYYATLALFQRQGDKWMQWNEALTRELLENQRRRGSVSGSWDPVGEWADKGGRVYQTALCAMMLEVYYRYLPLYSVDIPEDAIGTIEGLVTDARTGSPLAGATIHVDLPDRDTVSAISDATGHYELYVPEVPTFFAITGSRAGYVPDSQNVDAAMLQGRTLSIDFNLDRVSRDVISLEAVPAVHHLGDNQFSGAINSQFQNESEGDRFSAKFQITSAQHLPAGVPVEVRFMAKGVQRSHKILINKTVLETRLDTSPRDGSFGEFTATFNAGLLRAGANLFEIIAKPSSSDIDDFEFVNVQIHLSP